MQELDSILNMWQQSWQNPAMRHAMLIHFPIVLAFLLVPLALLTSVWAGTFRKTLIIFCFIIGLATAGTAWLAKDTGSQAHQALGTDVAPDVEIQIAAHGGAAVRVWWLSLTACGILLLACFGNKVWKAIARCLFFLSTVALAGYIAYVADLGGRLVYVEEVGVGVHPMNMTPPADAAPTVPATAPIAPPGTTSPAATPAATSTPAPPPPKPAAPAPPSAAENQAQLILGQAGLYEAKPGVWYLKQVNNFSPRVYNRLSTDGDVRAALRTLGGQLPPRADWGKRP